MSEQRLLLDPTAERLPVRRERVPRPHGLEGLTIGLLDISKARGDIFLNRIEGRLRERGLSVKRYRKPTFARVAPAELKREIADQCDLVIEALAD